MATEDRKTLEEQIKQLEAIGPRLPPPLRHRLHMLKARLETLNKQSPTT